MREIDDIQKGFRCCAYGDSLSVCGKCPYSQEDLDKCFHNLRNDVMELFSAFGYLKALSSAAVETIEALMGTSPGQYCSMCSKAYTPQCDRSEGALSCTPKWKENRGVL